MQKAYLMQLYEIAEKDHNVLLMLADSGSSYDELFKKSFPEQFLDFGIAEENVIAVASGMASCGKIPFIYTAGAFLAYRSMEFIRDDICLQNRNVKIIGMGTGLSWSTLGPTHHTTEDLGILRSIPNLNVLTPSCPSMTAKCIKLVYDKYGPAYIRIGMGGEKELYNNDYSVKLGGSLVLSNGDDVTIFSCGTILSEVLEARKKMFDKGISCKVIDLYSISPIDANTIKQEIESKKIIISVEEHNIIGGIGSAISEIIAESNISVKFLRIGLNNCFAKGYGSLDEVRKQNNLDALSIETKIEKFIGE